MYKKYIISKKKVKIDKEISFNFKYSKEYVDILSSYDI